MPNITTTAILYKMNNLGIPVKERVGFYVHPPEIGQSFRFFSEDGGPLTSRVLNFTYSTMGAGVYIFNTENSSYKLIKAPRV